MRDDLYLSGKKYISARRAAEITGYTSDYVGQLCRAGKVDATMVGRGWFISQESILLHKENFGITGTRGNSKNIDFETSAPSPIHRVQLSPVSPTSHSAKLPIVISPSKPSVVGPARSTPFTSTIPAVTHASDVDTRNEIVEIVDSFCDGIRNLFFGVSQIFSEIFVDLQTVLTKERIQKIVSLTTAVTLVFGSYAIAKNPELRDTYAEGALTFAHTFVKTLTLSGSILAHPSQSIPLAQSLLLDGQASLAELAQKTYNKTNKTADALRVVSKEFSLSRMLKNAHEQTPASVLSTTAKTVNSSVNIIAQRIFSLFKKREPVYLVATPPPLPLPVAKAFPLVIHERIVVEKSATISPVI